MRTATPEGVVKLIRDLSKRHPDIKQFYTGTIDQQDDSLLEYPCVRVISPYVMVPNIDKQNFILNIKVRMFTNVVEIDTGSSSYEFNINFSTENADIDKINSTDLPLESKMRGEIIRLAFHLIAWIRLSEVNFRYLQLQKVNMKTLERKTSDSTTGVQLNLSFLIGNPYICEAKELFKQTAI